MTDPILPNNAEGLAIFYNVMVQDRGISLPEHLVPVVHAITDPRISNLIVVIGPGSGKSMLLSQIYPAFQIGHDPSITILGVSSAEGLMQGFMAGVGDWVKHSEKYHMFFPNVRPHPNKPWSGEKGLFVTGHPDGDADATYLATGLGSKNLTGKHGRLMIFDDLHDKENSAGSEACARVRGSYYTQLLGRADPRGARFLIAGRRWHAEDLLGHLKDTGDFVVMELPAERKGSKELYWDVHVPILDGQEKPFECCFTDGSVTV